MRLMIILISSSIRETSALNSKFLSVFFGILFSSTKQNLNGSAIGWFDIST